MFDDTRIGGRRAEFPLTRWSAIVAARSDDHTERTRAFQTLIAAYWKPVYKYIRIRWNRSNEDAKDLTQGFFATALEKEFFQGFDPARARFRTFLRVCLDRYVSNEDKAAARIKRGGDRQLLSLDFQGADGELAGYNLPSHQSFEHFFESEWVRNLFALAVEDLRIRCHSEEKTLHWQLFERYDLHEDEQGRRPSYAGLAREYDLPVTQVTNYLAAARRMLRAAVLNRLQEITASEAEFRQEVQALFGAGSKSD